MGVCLCEYPSEPDAAQAIAAFRSMDVAEDWPFGEPGQRSRAAELLREGEQEDDAALKAEFARMFRGPNVLPAAPWGSVYMDRDQVRYGCTWLDLRNWMRARHVEAHYALKEPEDQIGRLLVMCSEVALERPDVLRELLGEHVLTWAFHYLDAFDAAVGSPTYAAVSALARITLEDLGDLLAVDVAVKRFYR